MARPRNFRLRFLVVVLLAGGAIQIALEHRPSFLRSGLHLCAYVSTDDGSITVVDLIRLAATAHVPVGPALSGIVEHPTRAEIWGVSTAGGYLWILDTLTNQVAARIYVGAAPYAVSFSPDGRRAYVTASKGESLLVVDCP